MWQTSFVQVLQIFLLRNKNIPKRFFHVTIARLTCSLFTPTSSPLTFMHSPDSYVGEAQEFPKVGLSNVFFEKWLHKATFQYQILFPYILLYNHSYNIPLLPLLFLCSLINIQFCDHVFFFQLEVKASKLFENMVDLRVSILEFMEVQNIQDFIKHWRLEL